MTNIEVLEDQETQGLIKRVKNMAAKKGLAKQKCAVKGCERKDVELTQLKAFDPIDHEDSVVQLCGTHQEWGEKRNELCKQVYDDYRKARKEIGQDYREELQKLARPDFDTPMGILDGEVDSVAEFYEQNDVSELGVGKAQDELEGDSND